MKTYIITGRIPDKENDCGWYKANSYAEAIGKFIKDLHGCYGPDERKDIIKWHGVFVYVDSVIETQGEAVVHLSGWGAMTDEAKKYESRKTAYINACHK